MEIDLAVDRDIFPSLWFDSIYALRQGAGISVLLQASRGFAVGGDISYHEHDYPTEATAPQRDGSLFTAKRNDQILRFGGLIRLRADRLNNISFRIGYFDRDSNFDTQEISGLVIGSGYSLVF